MLFNLFFIFCQFIILSNFQEENGQFVFINLPITVDVHLFENDVNAWFIDIVRFEESFQEQFDLWLRQFYLARLRSVFRPNIVDRPFDYGVNAHAFLKLLFNTLQATDTFFPFVNTNCF